MNKKDYSDALAITAIVVLLIAGLVFPFIMMQINDSDVATVYSDIELKVVDKHYSSSTALIGKTPTNIRSYTLVVEFDNGDTYEVSCSSADYWATEIGSCLLFNVGLDKDGKVITVDLN